MYLYLRILSLSILREIYCPEIEAIMQEEHLKYCLQSFVGKSLKASKITERRFVSELGIPWSTYQKDKSILISDSFSMPESRLLRYAMAYGVRMEDLINYRMDQECLVGNKGNSKKANEVCNEFGLS